MEMRSSTETTRGSQENTSRQRGKGTPGKRKKQTVQTRLQQAGKEASERAGGRRKKHPISLRPTTEIYELSETMANQRGKDRSVQDHNAHALGLIVEAVSGPAVDGLFGTLTPEELDERAIPLYIALGGYLKRRGKLPSIFGEGFALEPRESERQAHRNERSDGVFQPAQNISLALDEEAEAAFSGGPRPA